MKSRAKELIGLAVVLLSTAGCNKNKDAQNCSSAAMGTVNKKSAHVISINGVADLRNKTIENLSVNGVADLYNVIVNGETKINGVLTAEQSVFNFITIATKEMELSYCKVKAIQVRESKPHLTQTVKLVGTTVEGSITFDQGNGVIILQENENVNGAVIGGEIVTN